METMTRREELESIYWDMYKDAHGIRPRHIRLDLCSEAEMEADLDRLHAIIVDNERERVGMELRTISVHYRPARHRQDEGDV